MKKHIRTVHPGFAAWQKRLRVILVLALGVSVVLAISVALTISGLGYPGIAYVSGLGSFLAPFFLIGFLGRSREKKYQEEWSATHAETPAYSAAEDSTTQGFVTGDDQAIISSVNRLTPQFGLAPIEAVRVEWRDHTMPSQNPIRSSNAIMIPYDGCVFEHSKIVLPLTTKDMLSLEEWTPLVVSELLYERQFRKKRRIGLLIRIVPLTVIYLMLPVALVFLGILNLNGMTTVNRTPTPLWLAFYQVYSGTALMFAFGLMIIFGFGFEKRLRLVSDREVVRLVGKQAFLSGLGKIGAKFPDVNRGKRPSPSYPSGRPGIHARINSIQAA